MEENNAKQIPQETKVEEIKIKKSNTGLIIVLVLIILGLVGYIIFTRFSFEKKQPQLNNDINSTTNSDNNITNDMENVSYIEKNIKLMKIENEDTVYINYPVISGKDTSITALNNEIQNNVNKFLNEKNKDGIKITDELDEEEIECAFIEEKDNGDKYAHESYNTLNYVTTKNDKYIFIVEYENNINACDPNINYLNKIYSIDINNGKTVSNDEVKQNISNLEQIKNKLILYIDNKIRDPFEDNELDEEDKIIYVNELKNKIKNNNFSLFYDKNRHTCLYFENITMFGYKINNMLCYNTETDYWFNSAW